MMWGAIGNHSGTIRIDLVFIWESRGGEVFGKASGFGGEEHSFPWQSLSNTVVIPWIVGVCDSFS